MANWYTHAVELDGRLRSANPSERDDVLRRYGSARGFDPAMLPSILKARDFLDGLVAIDRGLAIALRAKPIGPVSVLRCWHERDAEAAKRAATDFIVGKYTARKLDMAEKASRVDRGTTPKETWLGELLGARESCFWDGGVPTDSPSSDNETVGGVFRAGTDAEQKVGIDLVAGAGARSVACVAPPPYVTAYEHSKHAARWVLRTCGAMAIYGRAALLLAPACPPEPYAEALRRARELANAAPEGAIGMPANRLMVARRSSCGLLWEAIEASAAEISADDENELAPGNS